MKIVYDGYTFKVEQYQETSLAVTMYIEVPVKFLGFRVGNWNVYEARSSTTIRDRTLKTVLPSDLSYAMDRLIDDYREYLAQWKAAGFSFDIK